MSLGKSNNIFSKDKIQSFVEFAHKKLIQMQIIQVFGSKDWLVCVKF